jgi:nitrate reductase gamma subunit
MLQRLQTQLIFLFIAFASLVVISVGVTYWGLQTQQQDSLIVNLAGRQRMLAQQMTRLTLQLQNGDTSTLTALQESEQNFSQTLSALRNGGTAPYFAGRSVTLPLVIKLHFLNGALLIAFFPFGRLVHMVSFPISYLWRSFQVVIWTRRKAAQ